MRSIKIPSLDPKANKNWVTAHLQVTSNLDMPDFLFYVHAIFTIIWFLLAHISKTSAEQFVKVAYPFKVLILSLDNRFDMVYQGGMSSNFYACVCSEVIVISLLFVLISIIGFCARYYNQPWQFVAYLFNRTGLIVTMIILIVSVLMVPTSLIMAGIFLFGVDLSSFSFDASNHLLRTLSREVSTWQLMSTVSILGFVSVAMVLGAIATPVSMIALVFKFFFCILDKN